jgi:uncharacterized protein YecT (DUF1311 family)
MRFIHSLLVLSCCFSISFNALALTPTISPKAIEQCEKQTDTTQKLSRCLDGVIEKVDKEVELWTTNQIFTLEELSLKTGRSAALTMFKRAQNTYQKYQQDTCRWQYLAASPDPRANIYYKKCYILLGISQIEHLQQFSTLFKKDEKAVTDE